MYKSVMWVAMVVALMAGFSGVVPAGEAARHDQPSAMSVTDGWFYADSPKYSYEVAVQIKDDYNQLYGGPSRYAEVLQSGRSYVVRYWWWE